MIKIESEKTKFRRKMNYILNSDSHSVYVIVWKILNMDAFNLKRRTDPILKERGRLENKEWRKKNPERSKELTRKSYNKHIDKRRLEKRMERLDPIKNERRKASLLKSYYKNRDKRLENTRIKNIKRRMQVLLYYSKGLIQCACCGELELEFLSVDHINGRKSFNHKRHMGGSLLVDWIIKNKYPDGFQVLCFNCNFARGKTNNKDRLCPHQRIKQQKIPEQITKNDLHILSSNGNKQ